MKRPIFIISLMAGLCWVCPAQEAAFKADAFLIEAGGAPRKISLLSATKNQIRFEDESGATVERALADGTAVFVCEPPGFAEAMDFYQGRKYLEAKAKFAGIKALHDKVQALDDSYASLSAFYELECLRKLGDLAGLAAALQKFPKGALSREHQLRQLELYVMWDAVRTENWVRVEELAKERQSVKLPADQRAQVAYCHGLALEGLKRPLEALLPYQVAITAGAGASEDVTRKAASRILSIYLEDSEVQAALKARGKQASRHPLGEARLAEAKAVTAWFKESFGADLSLPPKFGVFLK